jgi:N-acetylmuramoyl-L-alanine amidase
MNKIHEQNGGVVQLKTKRKLIAALAVIFALNILIIALVQTLPNAAAVSYKKGSTGSIVTEIQQKLSDWGYYSGSVDGVYGSKTEEAVKYFQSKNGLTADGIVGPATLSALGISTSSSASAQSNDVDLLARLISAEARGEPYIGQVAVGAVVLNRIEHPSFPNSMAGVIYQAGAFSCLDDGQFYEPVADSAYRAAQDALNGWDPSGGAIYYFNPSTATNSWIWSRPLIVTIGKHRFCA